MNSVKRWIYLGIASVLLLFLGLIYAWSIFRGPIGELHPDWSIAQLSLTFTISMIFFCLGGFAGGIMSKRLSIRARLLISAAMLFTGFFAVSMMNTSNSESGPGLLYVFYGVFGGGGVGVAYNTVISGINKWFPDKVGLASGIMLMGFGLGGLALGSAVNSLMGQMGVSAVFRLLAFVIAAVCVLAAFVIRLPADGEVQPDVKVQMDENAVNYSSSEMIRTSKFWIFTLWVILLNSAGLLVINSAADISVAFGGTVVLGMIVSLFNGAGRIIAGNNFDRLGRKPAMIINNVFMLLAGVMLTLGAVSGRYVFILCGLVLVGLAYGGCPTITSAYINNTFGPANFSTNFSIANFSLIPAATIGPMISSALLTYSGGSYDTNFYAIIAFALSSFVFNILLH